MRDPCCGGRVRSRLARFVSGLLQPLTLLWLAIVAVAAVRLLQGRFREALGPSLLAAAIWAIGGSGIPLALVADLERPWAGFDVDRLPRADAVVMPGGEVAYSPDAVFGFDVSAASDRALTAAEIVRRGKAGALVLGGSRHGPDRDRGVGPTEGDLLRRWFEAWKVVEVPIFDLGDCRDTHDEAVATATLARERGWKRIILVTSAAHMRRAEAVFRNAGLDVVPAPCDFEALARLADPGGSPVVSPAGFEQLGQWIHERLGWWVYRWRGWVD